MLIILTGFICLYLLFIIGLYVAGKKTLAREIGGFIPDCIILFKRLLSDKRVHLRHKIILILLIGYLVSPVDLVPDFIPIAGQLDDAIIVAFTLRLIVKGAGREIISSHWQGPTKSLNFLLKLARIDA